MIFNWQVITGHYLNVIKNNLFEDYMSYPPGQKINKDYLGFSIFFFFYIWAIKILQGCFTKKAIKFISLVPL